MQKKRAIPKEYMTVGELAKMMGITVRTLQYYDRENVLSPSAMSTGGRRLYTHKDMIQLHQILSLKSLGFSLDDIKSTLTSIDTPSEVANVLTEQALAIKEKIRSLTDSLNAIETLREEVLQIQTVDFKKYADIITNLQINNEYYWLIKHFDNETLEHIRGKFDKESGSFFMNRFNQLNAEAIEFQSSGIPPEDERAQALAKKFWDLVMEFTNGDTSMLTKLMELGVLENENHEREQKQTIVSEYLQPALDIYLSKSGMNPFKEDQV